MNTPFQIYLLAFMSFLVGTSQFIIVGVLDQIADSLGISVASAGQLVSVYALASAVGTPLVIILTAKIDQRTQLLLSLVIFIIGIFAMPLLESYFLIVLSRMVVGIGAGVFVVTAYAISAKLARSGKQGAAMSNIAMGFSLSLVLGVPLGRIITVMANWQMIFWLIGILSLISFFIITKVIPKTVVNPPIALRVQLSFLKQPQIIRVLGVTFFFFISFSLINTYITPFLFSIRHLGEEEISTILVVLGIASFMGSKLGGFLADRIGIARTLLGSMSVHLAMLLLLFFVYHSLFLTAVVLFIWVGASWTFGPTQSFNLASIAPKATGILLSLNSSFVQLGFAVGAGLGGVTLAHFPIIALCGVGAISVLIAFYLFQYQKDA
ncbi:MAG: MFS transporter [Campylobacteraceae bacterium]|nr:MFS transporter [Campylobacteraceae bacterium]